MVHVVNNFNHVNYHIYDYFLCVLKRLSTTGFFMVKLSVYCFQISYFDFVYFQ